LAELKGKGTAVEQDTTQKKLRFEEPTAAESSATISADSGPPPVIDLASPVSPGELEARRLAAEAPLYTE
jgi:hypothetical protein